MRRLVTEVEREERRQEKQVNREDRSYVFPEHAVLDKEHRTPEEEEQYLAYLEKYQQDFQNEEYFDGEYFYSYEDYPEAADGEDEDEREYDEEGEDETQALRGKDSGDGQGKKKKTILQRMKRGFSFLKSKKTAQQA